MRLIIVEGIPGSGKSSTSRFIALQSERNGFRTRLYHESAYQHPILIEENINVPHEWMGKYLANWDRFLSHNLGSDDTIVLEAVLFQGPVLNLLHMDVGQEEIVRFIEEIMDRISRADVSLVYLYQVDPNTGISRMMNDRGGATWLNQMYEKYKHEPYYMNRGQTGPELHLSFLKEYAEIARSAFERCRLDSLPIDNTSWDWRAFHRLIVEHFHWSYIPDPFVSDSDLIKFSGNYYHAEMNIEVQIKVKDRGLTIFGDYRLHPKESNKFYLDQMSILVHFVDSGSGEIDRLIIEEKDLAGNRNEDGTVFVRKQPSWNE